MSTLAIVAVSTLALCAGEVAHPVFPPQYSLDSAKGSVSAAMDMSPQELYDMVPVASGIFFCGCPNCDGGAQEQAMTWEPGMGDRVRCKHCGMVFPNESFPNNREKVIVAPSGAKQVYRWHENAAGRQYFFEARAWFARMRWTRTKALRLANVYAHAGDPEYGDRAAAIVGRFAQVFPDYAVRFDYPFQPVQFWPADQKWPYEGIPPFRGAKFYWWGYGDIPDTLARAYDLLAAGDAFERNRALLGDDIRERIETDLIRAGYEFVVANPDDHGNMAPGLYADMIVAGRIIGAPDMVHEAVSRFKTLVERRFFFDGWWREGAPSYHWQTVSHLLEVVEVAAGYSDPAPSPGLIVPEPRFDNLDLAAQAPLLQKALQVGDEGCLPDGRLMPVNDTWWHSKRSPLEESVPRLWPGLGHAILGAGAGADQFQAHINWNTCDGHTHMDSGALILFAHGKELLSDIGYTHTRYRNWVINSASHNMVVVDQRSQQLEWQRPQMKGNLRFFDSADCEVEGAAPDGSAPHVTVIDLDVQPAYPDCAEYRRRLVHVHVREGIDYLVDYFDVVGGEVHDYFLHGSADEEGVLETSLPIDREVASLVPEWGGVEEHTGENCIDVSGEKHHAYWFLWNVRAADATGPWTVTWRYDDVGLQSCLFPESDTTAFRFQAPSIRQARADDAKLHDYVLNGVMQRHTGGKSRFRAVHVPFRGAPWVSEVRLAGEVFTVSYVLGEGGETVTDTISWQDDRASVASTAGWRYDAGAPADGLIAAVERDGACAFRAEGPVPAARYVRLDFGGRRTMVYPVADVDGDRFLLSDDPGFAYDSAAQMARFLYYPHEELPGPVTWTAWH